ncbi:Protein of unknown function [Gryllus bimaculatus]|nr:Protein of unknown function [Gryllus bimaculatus]
MRRRGEARRDEAWWGDDGSGGGINGRWRRRERGLDTGMMVAAAGRGEGGTSRPTEEDAPPDGVVQPFTPRRTPRGSGCGGGMR